jgi:integrase
MKGSMTKRGADTWRLRVSLERGADGKRHYLTRTVQGGKREAQDALSKLLVEARERRAPTMDRRTTLAQYLKLWLEARKVQVKRTSWEVQEGIVRLHILPRIGGARMARLTSLDLEVYYAQLVEAGLKPSYVQSVHAVLSAAFSDAVRAGQLPVSPARLARRPRGEPAPRTLPSMDELQRVLEGCSEGWVRLAILLMAGTGLRRAEVLGLTWEDVDLGAGTLAVRRNLVWTRQAGTQTQTPKTKTSRRTLRLPGALVTELEAWRARQRAERLRTGARPSPDWVVHQSDGRPYSPQALTSAVTAAGERVGVKLHPHLLRHLHVTDQLRGQVPLKVVQERVGHSQASTTLNLYAHVLQGMEEASVAVAEALVAGMLAEGHRNGHQKGRGRPKQADKGRR